MNFYKNIKAFLIHYKLTGKSHLINLGIKILIVLGVVGYLTGMLWIMLVLMALILEEEH